MNFLITGAAGFIGSTLANQLAKEGHQVRGLDNLSAGNPQALIPDVHFTRGEVNDRPKLWTLLQEVDCVFHLAARVSVQESINYPREYNDVNVGGTVSLMEAMRDVGVRRVVLVSSGAIYGDQATQPLNENMVPNPKSPYAVSKLSAESYVRTIGKLWGIETVSLRVFNAFGPGQNLPPSYPPVVPYFLYQALHNGSIVIHSDGKQTRDYIFLDDVISALVAASTAPNLDGMVVNVGSGKDISVMDLVKLVGSVTGKKIDVIHNPKVAAGVSRMCSDITLAHQKLNFTPSISLEEGLRLTIQRDPKFNE